jgi:hypothetical protein
MLDNCNDNCDAITVHLVRCGEDEVLTQRKAAVELYLKTSEGPNTLTFHPADQDLIRFAKTESGKAEDAAAPTSADAGVGASTAAPTGTK